MLRRVTGILVAFSLVAAGCSSKLGHSASDSLASPDASADTKTVVIEVGAAPVLTLNGVVSISGPKGAFDGSPSITVRRVKPAFDTAQSAYVQAAGTGMDLTFPAGSLKLPLTLTFDVSAPPSADWQPVSMHQNHDGSWQPLPATYDGHGHIEVQTDQFSIQIPSWLNPAAWFNSIVTAATGFFGGRTQPDSCPPTGQPTMPAWASVTGPLTGATHVCVFENTDAKSQRVEVQLKSNRGTYLIASNPIGADYVFQNTRSKLATGIARNLFWIGPDEWLIAPGDSMTYGYRRTANTLTPSVNIHTNTSIIELSGLNALLGNFISVITGTSDVLDDVLGMYSFATCLVVDPVNLKLILASFADLLTCGISALSGLTDPAKALAAVQNFYGTALDNASIAQRETFLQNRAKTFVSWGRIFALVSAAQAIYPVWTLMLDAAAEMLKPTAGDITLGLDPTGPPVITVSFDARVLQAQIYMNIIGFTAHLDEDGLAGPATLGAIRQFQSLAGLAVTGLLDTATYNALASTPPRPPAGSGLVTGTWSGGFFTLVFSSPGIGILTLDGYDCTASVTQTSFGGSTTTFRYVLTSDPYNSNCTRSGIITSTGTGPTTSFWKFVGDDGSTTSGTATLTPPTTSPSTPGSPGFQTSTWRGPGFTFTLGPDGNGIVTLDGYDCTASVTQISFDGTTSRSRYVLTSDPYHSNCTRGGVITSTSTGPTTSSWRFVGDDGSTLSGTLTLTSTP